MGLIARPAKEGGFLTYVEKVLAGFEFILDSEADDDFATIYNEFNGNITDANVAALAAIAGSKLNLANAIGTAALQAGAVTTAKLADGAVTKAKLRTTTGDADSPVGGQTINTTETTLATCTLTTTGGSVLLVPALGTSFSFSTGSGEVTWRYKRGVTTIATISQPVISSGGSLALVTLPATPPSWVDAILAAGAYTYTLTVQLGVADGSIVTHPTNPGSLLAIELQ